jgi:hypothetical protein
MKLQTVRMHNAPSSNSEIVDDWVMMRKKKQSRNEIYIVEAYDNR